MRAHLHSEKGGAGLLGIGHEVIAAEIVLSEVLIVILLRYATHIDQIIYGTVVVSCGDNPSNPFIDQSIAYQEHLIHKRGAKKGQVTVRATAQGPHLHHTHD